MWNAYIENTRPPDETIDWVMFEQVYYVHSLLGELSSGFDSIRVVLIVLYCSPSLCWRGICYSMSSNESDMETSAEDVVRLDSFYTDVKHITLFMSKIDISFTRRGRGCHLGTFAYQVRGFTYSALGELRMISSICIRPFFRTWG